MANLYQRIEDRKADCIAEVVITFLEIYNEEIHDLLAHPGALKPRSIVKVAGLVELSPKSAEEVKEIPTHAHETSSRKQKTMGILSIIDFAGSERANINKFLLTLGNCINALRKRRRC
ncbi:P-loop containing nucleoside triphosphate hydrolase protein [Lentinula raphanica]|uniref:P-loop containing nucleoside triphosphate hydrolase protein n=1 Tax=Lentinula raphanica TaxID=153919 RepID=A0AA38P3N0_9AGAR|nr:P-loop containing nucleoside triphosphate hydrolase protein [Lentinula raphanica]